MSNLGDPVDDRRGLRDRLRELAAAEGFSAVGFAPAAPPLGALDRFRAWVAAGYAGEMHYLSSRDEAYADPGRILEGARGIVMLAASYAKVQPVEPAANEARVSRYAWGADYHDVLHGRMKRLIAALKATAPEIHWRGVVDSAPLLEREFARIAGLGWIGKHTLVLDRELGSWFFLAALLADVDLGGEATLATDHCGSCTACLDACPTDAFVAPYQLDATKCISYLTIELRGPIPQALRPGIGDWLFGCDVCQDVCPWNRRAPRSDEREFRPREGSNPISAIELLSLDEAAFRRRFRGTPLWRAKRRGLLRNAAIVLGNQPPTTESRAALSAALCDDESLVRGAAAWALGRHGDAASRGALGERLAEERDTEVLREIRSALDAGGPAR